MVCGQALGVEDDRRRPPCRDGAPHQQHCLGNGRRLVKERRAGDGQRGEVAHHGLEVQHRLEAALGDLRLVRRVGRVPGRILQHVAANHHGRDGVVVALADHRHLHLVALREALKRGEGLVPRRARAATPARRPAGSTPERPPRRARQGTGSRPRRACARCPARRGQYGGQRTQSLAHCGASCARTHSRGASGLVHDGGVRARSFESTRWRHLADCFCPCTAGYSRECCRSRRRCGTRTRPLAPYGS